MPLNDQDRRDIAAIVSAALAEHSGKCSCGLDPLAAKEMGHFMGMVKDIGGGKDIGQGIEAMRDGFKQLRGLSAIANKVGWIFLGIVASAASLGIVAGIVEAARKALEKG